MPAPTTSDDLLDLVRKSGVVEEKRLNSYLERLRAVGPLPADPSALAGLMVRDGVLTRFQAEFLLQGKWRRFSIGKYKVLEKLGSGGMGTVYLCEHKLMRRRVAVKVLPTAKAEDVASLDRFHREARAVAALDHPNIVRAYDVDQDDNLHYLVMEHVDGSNLQEIVKKTGPMDIVRACHYVRQAALGLQHAHESAGIVHRDIKPSNILVDRNGIVKILDMGLALFFYAEDDVITRKYDENVLGTADYLAPEQAMDSHAVDIRADIYSLGATFYFCLSGRTPFSEGSVAQKLIWHQTRQPKSLLLLRPELPPALAAVIDRMMAKDPAQRYQSPREVADALTPWTQTPIPPPPDCEMPQLSPAVQSGSPSLDQGTGPVRTAGPDLLPTPRKSWQVPTASSPPPPTRSAGTPPPPQPPGQLRKSTPPGGFPEPPPAAAPRPAPVLAGVSVAAPAAPARTTGTVPAAAPPARPLGYATPSAAPTTPLLSSPITTEEEIASWDALATQPAVGSTVPAAGVNRNNRRTTARVRTVEKKAASRKTLWLVLGGATGLFLLAVGGLVLWVVLSPSPPRVEAPIQPTLTVSKSGQPGTFPSLRAALHQARGGKSGQGARILVQCPLEEEVTVDVPGITIEADAGQPLLWKAPPRAGNTSKLVLVSKAADFHLRGFLLDGDNRLDCLILLFSHCPGTTLEGLTFQNFKQCGCYVTNCEGGADPDRHLLLQNLTFITTRPDQAGLFFTLSEKIPEPHKNRYITVRSPELKGNGARLKTPQLSFNEDCDLPDPVTIGK